MRILANFSRILPFATILFASQILSAQEEIGIAQTTIQEPTLTIENDPKLDQLLEIKKQVELADESVYRIQLFFGKNAKAEKILKEFRELYPGWNASINFETPYYKVRVGRYTSRLMADQRLAEVKKKFPNAFLLAPQKK